jgi:hypothetical protein
MCNKKVSLGLRVHTATEWLVSVRVVLTRPIPSL